jgi:hypothetical protein
MKVSAHGDLPNSRLASHTFSGVASARRLALSIRREVPFLWPRRVEGPFRPTRKWLSFILDPVVGAGGCAMEVTSSAFGSVDRPRRGKLPR